MSLLFGRSWRVVCGVDATTGLATSDLDVKFKIERHVQGRAGKCLLEIYNLTEAHRHQLLAVRRPFVQVAAGYGPTPPVLFQGNGRKVFVEREDTTWTTRITAGDGEYALRSARVVAAFGPGTGIAQVAQAIATAMGVGIGNAATAFRGATLVAAGASVFPEGTVLQGWAADELSRLCEATGTEWSVQDGNLQILPLGGALQRPAVLLSPSTGLVGSPAAGKGAIVKAKALLGPLQSEGITGVFRVEKVTYTGESTAGATDWYADLVLRAVPS